MLALLIRRECSSKKDISIEREARTCNLLLYVPLRKREREAFSIDILGLIYGFKQNILLRIKLKSDTSREKIVKRKDAWLPKESRTKHPTNSWIEHLKAS